MKHDCVFFVVEHLTNKERLRKLVNVPMNIFPGTITDLFSQTHIGFLDIYECRKVLLPNILECSSVIVH